jgi:hypothetical protein
MIVGSIGTKKSSNETALVQLTERCKIEDMQEFHYKAILLLMSVIDFVLLDGYILEKLDKTHVYTDEDYIEFAKQFIKDTYDDSEMRLEVFEEVIRVEAYRHIKAIKLLAEYVEVFYYLNIRKRHVLSNTSIESINTGLRSIPYAESIDQLFRPNKYANERFLVKSKDEQGIFDNSRLNARMDAVSIQENDDGKDVDAMIQRHGSKGTTTSFIVSQSEKDVTANRRRLPNRIIEFLKPKEVFVYDLEIKILRKLQMYLMMKEERKFYRKMKKMNKYLRKYSKKEKSRYLRKAKKLSDKYSDYLVRINRYKKTIRKLYKADMQLTRTQYLIQYSFMHESVERVGKTGQTENTIASSMPIIFVFPVGISYERYDQYSFYGVYNERNKAATIPLSAVPSYQTGVMQRADYEIMDARATNRIYQEIDKQVAKNSDTEYIDKSMF